MKFGSNVYDKTKEIGHKAIDGTKSAIDTVKHQSQEKGGFVNYAKYVGETGITSAKKVMSTFYDRGLNFLLGTWKCDIFYQEKNRKTERQSASNGARAADKS